MAGLVSGKSFGCCAAAFAEVILVFYWVRVQGLSPAEAVFLGCSVHVLILTASMGRPRKNTPTSPGKSTNVAGST